MVQVQVLSLLAASLRTIGSIGVMTCAGVLMTRLEFITDEVRRGLGHLSINLLLPCLMCPGTKA